MEWSLGPFSGDPWTNASFAAIELLLLVLAGMSVVGAWRAGRDAGGQQEGEYHRLWAMIAAFFLTLGLELVMTGKGGFVDDPSYRYGDGFLALLSGVPLWVPIGWGAIIYVSMRTSDRLLSQWWLRPVMDGLLALNIDFALDPIAANNGWWFWKLRDPGEGFFGIPGGNFMAWFVIVAGLSLAIRVAYRSPLKGLRGLLGGLIPVTVSVAVMAGVLALLLPLVEAVNLRGLEGKADVLMIGAWVTVGAAIIVWDFPFRRDSKLDRPLMAFPVLLHGLFLILLASMNVREAHAELTVFLPLVAVVGLAAYGWPYLDEALKRTPEGGLRHRLRSWGGSGS